jgi:uncharacterized CHY-type Zn-finger protein
MGYSDTKTYILKWKQMAENLICPACRERIFIFEAHKTITCPKCKRMYHGECSVNAVREKGCDFCEKDTGEEKSG